MGSWVEASSRAQHSPGRPRSLTVAVPGPNPLSRLAPTLPCMGLQMGSPVPGTHPRIKNLSLQPTPVHPRRSFQGLSIWRIPRGLRLVCRFPQAMLALVHAVTSRFHASFELPQANHACRIRPFPDGMPALNPRWSSGPDFEVWLPPSESDRSLNRACSQSGIRTGMVVAGTTS
jgi:hypothetical protein